MISGENVSIPHRIHFKKDVPNLSSLDKLSQQIFFCLMSRSTDGLIRQQALGEVLKIGYLWSIPFVLKLIGEYVIEIIDDIDQAFEVLDRQTYRFFILENIDFFNKLEPKIISYWNVHYRDRKTPLENYVGFRVFEKFKGLI